MPKVVPHAGTWIEIIVNAYRFRLYTVVPHAGTWIEMYWSNCTPNGVAVVPHAGTWIEIELLQMRWQSRTVNVI